MNNVFSLFRKRKRTAVIIVLIIAAVLSQIIINFSPRNRSRNNFATVYGALFAASIPENGEIIISDTKNYYMLRYFQNILKIRKDIKIYTDIYPFKYKSILSKRSRLFFDRNEELWGFTGIKLYPAGIIFSNRLSIAEDLFNFDDFYKNNFVTRSIGEQETNLKTLMLYRLMGYYYINNSDIFSEIFKMIGDNKLLLIEEHASFLFLLINTGNSDLAREDIQNLFSNRNDIFIFNYLMGLIELSEGKTEKAVTFFSISLEQNPLFSKSAHHLAYALKDSGQIERALKMIGYATTIVPWYPAYLLDMLLMNAEYGKIKNEEILKVLHSPVLKEMYIP
ncbi:MAG: hypothetical protein KAS39_01165, partial [Actinomycetia bacterium]|nr:hypothetical protein [Actinomycetes bacterium]